MITIFSNSAPPPRVVCGVCVIHGIMCTGDSVKEKYNANNCCSIFLFATSWSVVKAKTPDYFDIINISSAKASILILNEALNDKMLAQIWFISGSKCKARCEQDHKQNRCW